ncbi:MAG TPA: hydroxyacid dehydrogenase [Dehalococcoidia bacterium]|nr:hydroxyacid dehydrogenase [Chloroflexota bacterium]HCE76752.1 hydroxyacid dehydrogenase [Dehalococcoidia bacterium]|tara:strand:- start:24378 stop:25328 length:951 start_codon:yes stop_codon:yes gene_type:complete
MLNIAVLDDYQNVAFECANWSELAGKGSISIFNDHIHCSEPLIDRLKEFEIICAMRERTPFSKEILHRLPKLQLLITSGMRNASIDVKAANAQGVTVCGTDGLPYPTAELTWGLILDLARNISRENEAVKLGEWQTTLGVGLKGKTLGLIGLGNLGGQVADYGNAFGMNVIAWSENLTDKKARDKNARYVELNTLMSESDFISIHTVLSERTLGLIDSSKLRLMKKSSFIVNTSRGPIIDESALVEVLENAQIAGAGLDVFDLEPMPSEHPLVTSSRTIITPHIGYVTEETYKIFYEQTVECVTAFLNRKPVRVLN